MNHFLAKTKDKETIIEHTEKLLEQYEILKVTPYIIQGLNWELLRLACIYHDIGKMNTKFQNKIMKKLNSRGEQFELLEDVLPHKEEVPHGYIGPAFLDESALKEVFNDDEMKVLYQAIYYHHDRPVTDTRSIYAVITEDLSRYIGDFKYDKLKEFSKLNNRYNQYIATRISRKDEVFEEETIKQYILVKGLLNKIDYAASSGIKVEKNTDHLKEKTLNFFDRNHFKLNDLQTYMLARPNQHHIIIASTGIGKTEAALLWIGNQKGFFTLPLKVSINAIYDRVIDEQKIQHDKDKTGLLHSDTRIEYMQRNEHEELDEKLYEHTKQLSMPLTICTLDQLIDFIFKSEGYELKLATLAYSKIVIDEIQMYNAEMIGFLILALREIHLLGGYFSILTATLPPVFVEFLKCAIPDIEFIPEKFIKYDNQGKPMVRHRIKVEQGAIEVEGIIKYYGEKRILVIVNTIKKAQALYDELIALGYDQVQLLHGRFIKKDRSRKERTILEEGRIGEAPCIWITTQIVEASLDIDFDVLYTELSDLAGLFQRMGRVFRNRLVQEFINIYIYVGGTAAEISGVGRVIDKDIFKLSREALIDIKEELLTEEDKLKLIEIVYSTEKLRGTDYYKQINNTIATFKDIPEYELEKGEIKLRDIKSKKVIPYFIEQQFHEHIEKIKIQLNSKIDRITREKLREELSRYTVTIPEIEYETARKGGFVLEELELDAYTRIPILCYGYSYEKGLYRYNPDVNGFCEENQYF